ncbi:MAG TPA: 16S rRNA (adenine(1518)-N(6)/adenine(1519)-N(6))-dimethyltransferase RsmA [Methanocorpusculum sp.]|nr:16S rRNA (adenine(1518)-N(6)/adenine(1519)-N(6))-dimethyltransferase RsmA [Methanocorpusculum sp.]
MGASFDQHFLCDADAVEKIAEVIPVKDRTVLEIGPGGGVLTRALLDRGAVVHAVELDKKLLANLESRFADELACGRFSITVGDASKVALPEYEIVIANLPYSISSKITFRLLEEGFECAVLMYQLEFAKRMAAPSGDGEYGRLSVMCQTYADVEFVMELAPESFSPPPEVWSAVVKITPHEPPQKIFNRKVHADVVRECFSHRRKTVRNCLKGLASVYGKDTAARLSAALPDSVLDARPEKLSVTDFISIANLLAGML